MIAYADYGIRDCGTYEHDKYGNTNKKYLNGTLVYEGITDNTGTVTRAIDHTNNLQYDYTYDSTDRLITAIQRWLAELPVYEGIGKIFV